MEFSRSIWRWTLTKTAKLLCVDYFSCCCCCSVFSICVQRLVSLIYAEPTRVTVKKYIFIASNWKRSANAPNRLQSKRVYTRQKNRRIKIGKNKHCFTFKAAHSFVAWLSRVRTMSYQPGKLFGGHSRMQMIYVNTQKNGFVRNICVFLVYGFSAERKIDSVLDSRNLFHVTFDSTVGVAATSKIFISHFFSSS